MSIKDDPLASKIDGSESLIHELNEIFKIITKELHAWRTGWGGDNILLKDEKMIDVVMKLVDKSDKIKKLAIVEPTAETTADAKPEAIKMSNIQDFTLGKTK